MAAAAPAPAAAPPLVLNAPAAAPPLVLDAPAAAPPPLVLDAHADTLDHVVRAVAHSGFLPQAARLMLASPEHLHDPELLYRTRGVRGACDRTLLMCASSRLDVARAAEILGACPTSAARNELLACVDDKGFNALHLACRPAMRSEAAALRMVELLLASGADPQAPQRDPTDEGALVWRAINFAAQWSARLVQRLVQAGAPIDGGIEGDPSLCAAAGAGTAQGVRMLPRLVALGARDTLDHEAMRALAQRPAEGASDGELVAALDALVHVGCSLSQRTDGWTPLDWAAGSGNAPLLRALLSLGAPAAASSLLRAVKQPELVRALLAAGAPVDARVVLGGPVPRSPLMEAAFYAALESVEVLLAAGASVDFRDGTGETALFYSAKRNFDPRVTEALLAAGADVNAQDRFGATALHWIVAIANDEPWEVDAARLLLQRGADTRGVNNHGFTPAQWVPAAQHGSELHRLLLEAAAA